jgi:hypothetical protein
MKRFFPWRRSLIGAVATIILSATALGAHDLFLRLENYFVEPGSDVVIHALNGTFSKSEGAVTRDRLRSLDLVSGVRATKVDTTAWTPHGDTTTLTIRAGNSGTYIVGASLFPRSIELAAKDFNEYLRTDGLPDVLEARRRDNALELPAKEMYQKHVKAIFQVGATRTGGFDRVLGYPAELVPLANPYDLRPGGALRVRALVDGRPVARQLVMWGGRTPSGARIEARSTRTDSSGVARLAPVSAGVWYVKFINMVPAPAGDTVNYHSKWATLTFAVSPRRAQ